MTAGCWKNSKTAITQRRRKNARIARAKTRQNQIKRRKQKK